MIRAGPNRAMHMPTNAIAAIIQARTGSTRLPGKVLRPLAGRPMIEHIIRRAMQARGVTDIVLAVPDHPDEQPLVDIARQMGIRHLQGPEEDVLQRFILAGNLVRAEHIIRICADSPLFDIPLLESLVETQLQTSADYTFPGDSIPLGAGTEVVRFAILNQIAQKTTSKPHREHVTVYIHDHPEQFRIERVPPPPYLTAGKHFRLTVDTETDFQLLSRLYEACRDPATPVIDLEKALAHLAAHPDLARINADVKQKDWRLEK